jgi:hypothetical protein
MIPAAQPSARSITTITIGDLTVDFVADTYTPRVDRSPNAAEHGRYMKLVRNMEKTHGIVVRVPKPWALGHVLDKEKLSEATGEICEQIRKMLERGELDPGKDKLFLEKLLDKLTKAKPKPDPSTETDVRK